MQFAQGMYMRPHYEAIGRVASAAVANGDTIVNSYDIPSNERGHLGLHIEHRETTFRVNVDPGAQYLNVSVGARLSKRDDIDTSDLPSTFEARRALFSGTDIEAFDGTIRVLEFNPNGNDGDPMFDGIRVVRPLYAYESDFSFKHYREVITDIVPRMNDGFAIVTDELDIDFTSNQSIPSEEEDTASGPSFY
jgi:hypothetical protein